MSESLAGELVGHVPRMYRVALRVVGDPDDAHDVVQEACVKAIRGVRGFDGRSAVVTWLHRITVNAARDHLRRQRRVAGRDLGTEGDLSEMLVSTESSPSVRAEMLDLYRTASAWVGALPTELRRSFVLTQLDGYSYDEAADIEGLPRGTVASRVNRARKVLLDQMRDLTAERASP
ncbi:MAG: sigma-70 family RNA polymerase sigma factor [Phycisphaerae bacterium]|nr:sigma-70 family RNA polymerase sigma factor [Phycisphaerae bacterium]